MKVIITIPEQVFTVKIEEEDESDVSEYGIDDYYDRYIYHYITDVDYRTEVVYE